MQLGVDLLAVLVVLRPHVQDRDDVAARIRLAVRGHQRRGVAVDDRGAHRVVRIQEQVALVAVQRGLAVAVVHEQVVACGHLLFHRGPLRAPLGLADLVDDLVQLRLARVRGREDERGAELRLALLVDLRLEDVRERQADVADGGFHDWSSFLKRWGKRRCAKAVARSTASIRR